MSLRTLVAALFLTVSMAAGAAVDVNRASQADLETVKGIGPGLSAKILAARGQGPFKDWSDFVDRVGGVGPGNAARFSDAGLTVGGQAWAGAPKAKTDKADKTDKAGDGAAPARRPAREKAAAAKADGQ